MRLHVISPFHTKNQQYFSHCAFTGKSLRFPKMMKPYGYEVIEYSNEGSESMADEHVQMLNHDEFNSFYGADNISSFEPLAIIGGPGHICFHERLIGQISNRIEPNDIICHTFGHCHEDLKNIFPNNFHVETGIGYPTIMDGTFHIFESYAWLHYNHGIKGTGGSNYEWVVPNYYDLDDWIPNYEHGKYLSFMGRVTQCKGLNTIMAIADNSKYPILIHGHGDHSAYNHPNVKFLGPIFGKDRSDFIRNSRALLAPTTFIEPFCGMAVESMLCGTPVISVDYGAMTETVEDGMGFRCHTLQDWLDAVDDIEKLDREYIAHKARNKYSLEACGKKYDKIFKQLDDLKNKKGWYQINNDFRIYDKFFNKLDSEDIFFAVIGAMDGVNHDNTFKYAFKNKHWKGLLIEPMKYYFEKLKENYEHRENLIFENVAISDSEGYEYMFRIPSELVESGEVPSWSDGISTFYPEKNVMREEHLISKAVKEPVLCTTFENISNKHSIEKIDVLQIDVEGCDSNVFWQIWNLNYSPKLIIIEIVNMQSEEKNKIEKTLKNNSYILSYVGDDLIATKEN